MFEQTCENTITRSSSESSGPLDSESGGNQERQNIRCIQLGFPSNDINSWVYHLDCLPPEFQDLPP